MQQLFGHRGPMDDETMYNMEVLMVNAANGNLNGWPDVLRTGKYAGDILEDVCSEWAGNMLPQYDYCASELLMQLADESEQLAQAVDYMAESTSMTVVLTTRLVNGEFF